MKIQDVICRELPSIQSDLSLIFRKFPKESEVLIKEVQVGKYVVREGNPCLNVYLVLEGKVEVQYYSGHNAFVARRFGRLAIMGDVAVMGNLKNYSTNVQAVTNCRLLEIRSDDYWHMLQNDEDFLKRQMEQVVGILLGELKNKRALEEETRDIRLLNYFVYYCRKVQFTRDYTGQRSDGRGAARQIFHVIFKLSLVAAMVVIIKSTTRRLSSKDTFSQVSR